MSYKDSIRNLILKISKRFNVFLSKVQILHVFNFFKFKYDSDQKLISNLSDKKIPSLSQLMHVGSFMKLKEKRIFYTFIVIGVFSLLFLIYRGISTYTINVPLNGGEYVEGLVGNIQYINPILSQNNDVDRDLSRLIFSGLFKINNNGELENDLIKDYSVSDDKRQYTFNLKDNIYWHDGVSMNVEDIEFTLYAIQNQSFNSPLYKTFQGVGYEKVSDQSFKLILEEPFAPFLSTLTFGILPSHLWQDIPPENVSLVELNKKPIGTGPYKFFSMKKDSYGYIKQYTLSKFENYYSQKPHISKIIFKFYGDLDQVVDALKGGKILGTSYIPTDVAEKIGDMGHFNLNQLKMPRYSSLFFNPRKLDILKEKKIRQAFNFAIDKNAIAKELNLEGREAYGPMDFLIEPQKDEYSVDKARALFTESGWRDDGGALKKGGKQMQIKITTIDNSDYIKISELIKNQLSSLGISVEVETIDRDRIFSQIIEPRNYQILLYSQILSYDPDPYVFWHSSQIGSGGLNLSIFSDKDIDATLEDARKLNTFEERKEKYVTFQKILKDEAYAVFLFDIPYNYPLNKKVKGFESQVVYSPSDRFFNIEDWYMRSRKVFKTKK